MMNIYICHHTNSILCSSSPTPLSWMVCIFDGISFEAAILGVVNISPHFKAAAFLLHTLCALLPHLHVDAGIRKAVSSALLQSHSSSPLSESVMS